MSAAKAGLRTRLGDLILGRPFLRRLSWHARRVAGAVDRRFLLRLVVTVMLITVVLAIMATVVEGRPLTLEAFAVSLNWAVHAVFGKGDAAYFTTLGGFVVSWLVVLFGAALVGLITAGLVAVVIDYLLKEGQGMGAAGFRGHVVICGWNATARELVSELRGDDYQLKAVVINNSERNPAGPGIYFVKGDPTSAADLQRAGISEASAAIIFPADDSPDSDMRSILTAMAIEALAPDVRTVAAVNSPNLVEHFHRAKVDEVLVPSRLASRLLARAALYPGLTDLVTDIVSGGRGSELYRVEPPIDYFGLSIDEVSRRLRGDHRATLVAVVRDKQTITNPPTDLYLQRTDELVVVAESLGKLKPATMDEDQGPAAAPAGGASSGAGSAGGGGSIGAPSSGAARR